MAGIDNNTILYLRGDSFTDLSPNPKTVVNNGVTLANDGIFGKCFKFGSSKPYMSISNLSFKGNYTIEFWMYNKGITNYWQQQIETNNNTLIITHMGGERAIKVLINGSIELISPNNSAPVGEWLHIALVKSGSNKTNLYINGILKASNSASYSLSFSALNVGAKSGTDYINGFIDEVSVSNIARYAEDFTPPTQPYNSITINKSNETDTNIEFNIEKLGQETINKVEVLVNNVLSKTYDTIGDLIYNIDKSLLLNGNNKIKIKVTFDNDYTEEKEFNYEYKVDNLSTSSSLKELIDRQELLTNAIEGQKNTLKSILESKNVVVSEEENKLSNLIGRVNELGDAPPPPMFLYKDGNEYTDITGGFVSHQVQSRPPTLTKTSSYMEYKAQSGSYTSGNYGTNLPINVTDYSLLKFEVETLNMGSTQYGCNFGLTTNKDMSSSVASTQITTNKSKHVISIDISNIRGLNYVYSDTTYNNTSRIYKIWLEK